MTDVVKRESILNKMIFLPDARFPNIVTNRILLWVNHTNRVPFTINSLKILDKYANKANEIEDKESLDDVMIFDKIERFDI